MKKILYAQLQATQTTDLDGNACEWQWAESSEAEYGHEWDGDLQGFLDNLSLDDGLEIKNANDYTIHNCPAGAMVLANAGDPSELYWVEGA